MLHVHLCNNPSNFVYKTTSVMTLASPCIRFFCWSNKHSSNSAIWAPAITNMVAFETPQLLNQVPVNLLYSIDYHLKTFVAFAHFFKLVSFYFLWMCLEIALLTVNFFSIDLLCFILFVRGANKYLIRSVLTILWQTDPDWLTKQLKKHWICLNHDLIGVWHNRFQNVNSEDFRIQSLCWVKTSFRLFFFFYYNQLFMFVSHQYLKVCCWIFWLIFFKKDVRNRTGQYIKKEITWRPTWWVVINGHPLKHKSRLSLWQSSCTGQQWIL